MKSISLLLGAAAVLALSSLTVNAAEPVKKLLVVTTTTEFRHSSIPTAEKVIEQLAKKSGEFTVEFLRQPEGQPNRPRGNVPPDARLAYSNALIAWEGELKNVLSKLAPDSLKDYDGVIFANTTGNLPIPDRDGFLSWLRSGKAFIGMHSASDTFHGWPAFIEMIGGEFQSHGPQVGVECCNEDMQHPSTVHLGKTWKIPQEEIYLFKNYDASRVHELLILEKHPNNQAAGRYPVAWTREFGGGKVFYTSLGHREDIWDTDPNIRDRRNPVEVSEAYQAHILGGIRWALGIAK